MRGSNSSCCSGSSTGEGTGKYHFDHLLQNLMKMKD